jgi:type III pantothenate kinase
MVEGMVNRFRKEMGGKPKVVATGGLAPLIATQTTVIDEQNQDLTLVGLKIIHNINVDNGPKDT